MEEINNRVLLRQLKKSKIKDLSSIDEEKLEKFLKLVQETYKDMDENVYRLERALELSTSELQELNDNLEIKVKSEVEKNRKKDDKLIHQSRYASMGEMIANIAHQWRQPLSAISSTSSSMILQMQLDIASKKEIENSFSKILGFTSFLTQTIEDFRSFFKQNKEKEQFYIVEYMDKTIELITASYRDYQIKIIHNQDNKNPSALGFPNELTQVFLNILNNAKDILATKNDIERIVLIDYLENEEFNIIKINDNASGIPESIMDSIFDPYFTTKHKAQGTGIGLYMCKQIIEKHIDGKIEVSNKEFSIENKKYFGACFKIYLPK